MAGRRRLSRLASLLVLVLTPHPFVLAAVVSAMPGGLSLSALNATTAADVAAEALRLASTAAADLSSSLPFWFSAESLDVVLNFSKFDVSTPSEKWFHGNTAILQYNGKFIMAVRLTSFVKTARSVVDRYPKNFANIHWWKNAVQLCELDPIALQPKSCFNFDPRGWKECYWLDGYEATGVEDPRLIPWPGKGLYMMFGSKPWQKSEDDTSCEGRWRFQPFLVLLDAPNRNADDPWVTDRVVRLQYEESSSSKEKNWNPFVYNGELYFSQSYRPHVVIKPDSNGTCTRAYVTENDEVFKDLVGTPRGNTNLALVPASFSGEAQDFYLGIIHYRRRKRPVYYRNLFYKMAAQPPFAIYQLSADIPFIHSSVPTRPWLSAAFPLSLQVIPEARRLLIGYGSGDHVSVMKVMAWDHVNALFRKGTGEVMPILDY